MKRFLTFLAAAVSVTFAAISCQENNPEVAGPAITWPSNPNFEPMTIDENLDASLTITAEAGIQTLVVKVDSESESFMNSVNVMFGTTTLDLINDQKVIETLAAVAASLPTGDALLNKTEVNFDITSLAAMITVFAGTETENHIFAVTVTDNNAKPATATCIFRTEPASEENPDENPGEEVTETAVTWPGNADFEPVVISKDMDATLKVTAVGGIKGFVVTAPESLATILKGFGLSTEMDFINDETVIEAISVVAKDMPTGDALKGKTSVDFDIAPLVNTLGLLIKAGDYEFGLKVTDSSDKEVSVKCTFTKEASSLPSIPGLTD